MSRLEFSSERSLTMQIDPPYRVTQDGVTKEEKSNECKGVLNKRIHEVEEAYA